MPVLIRLYLECDNCGARVETTSDPAKGLKFGDGLARVKGWSFPAKGSRIDAPLYCPECECMAVPGSHDPPYKETS